MWMARSGGDRFDAAPLDSGLGFWHAGRRVTAHGPVGTSGSVSQLCPSTSFASRRFAISRRQLRWVGLRSPMEQRRPPGPTPTDHPHATTTLPRTRRGRRRRRHGFWRAQSFRPIGTNALPRQISCNPQSAWAVVGFHGIDAVVATLPICAAVRPAALCPPTEDKSSLDAGLGPAPQHACSGHCPCSRSQAANYDTGRNRAGRTLQAALLPESLVAQTGEMMLMGQS